MHCFYSRKITVSLRLNIVHFLFVCRDVTKTVQNIQNLALSGGVSEQLQCYGLGMLIEVFDVLSLHYTTVCSRPTKNTQNYCTVF